MKRLNLFKYGLTALMMAFAMTLCYSCSSDDDEETPGEKKESKEEQKDTFKGDGKINGHDYVELAGIKWATENVGQVNGVEAIAGPDTKGNGWGCYYYTQANAIKAAESWGGTWTLPTEAQWMALMDENKCTWRQDSYLFNGKTMNGYKVSDKKDASKFIFLPAAGHCYNNISYVGAQGYDGQYWSADAARCFSFGDYDYRVMAFNYGQSVGDAVRPVAN